MNIVLISILVLCLFNAIVMFSVIGWIGVFDKKLTFLETYTKEVNELLNLMNEADTRMTAAMLHIGKCIDEVAEDIQKISDNYDKLYEEVAEGVKKIDTGLTLIGQKLEKEGAVWGPWDKSLVQRFKKENQSYSENFNDDETLWNEIRDILKEKDWTDLDFDDEKETDNVILRVCSKVSSRDEDEIEEEDEGGQND